MGRPKASQGSELRCTKVAPHSHTASVCDCTGQSTPCVLHLQAPRTAAYPCLDPRALLKCTKGAKGIGVAKQAPDTSLKEEQ
jgi:hypothetical protein